MPHADGRVDTGAAGWATSRMIDEKPPQDPLAPAIKEEPAVIAERAPTQSASVPPWAILAFIIIALLGAVVAVMLRNSSGARGGEDANLARIKAEYNALLGEYNKDRASVGMSPIATDSEPIEDIANRLKRDTDSLVGLASSYQNFMAEKDAELMARNAKILSGEKLRADLIEESRRLRGELQQALANGADTAGLRQALDQSKSRADALRAELDAANDRIKSMANAVSSEDFTDIKRRLDETTRAKEFFEARVKELESTGSKVKLFASSENELLPAAVELVRSLRKIENTPGSDILSVYKNFGVELGADVLRTITFATGSSTLSPADEAAIRELPAMTPEGDLLIAIGYASKTGNVTSNQTLSSERATAVAQMIESIKRPGQETQAVFLGQTDRFSSKVPERNQVVEIWQVRKK